ncbi:MAG: molybdenum cofactor synthesis domain-containing protein [Pseudomonadota bacterium]
MSALFDTVLMVDWSSRNAPSPRRPTGDAIWIGSAGDGAAPPAYFRTRAAAMGWLAAALAAARAEGRRVLVGFDFPFGYPAGFAGAVTGRAEALALWSWLAARVADDAENANNRFDVAAAINARLPGIGPFWGRPASRDLPDLPARGRERSGHGFAERRIVERRVARAQPVWKLFTTGSVGGQVLVGLPALERLRRAAFSDALAIWPFEGGLAVPDRPMVIAEIYPSLLGAEVAAARAEGEILDAAQVRVTADAFHALDWAGGLAPLFSGAPELTPGERHVVETEEAWILGAGHEPVLRAAAASLSTGSGRGGSALPPGVDWLPVAETLARIQAAAAPVALAETVALAEAGGRILAEPLAARRANPPAANAAVDGYGFAAGAPAEMPLLSGRAAAGQPYAGTVPPSHALRILTGALLPPGVDTVVLQEEAEVAGGRLRLTRMPKAGANTRPAGEDVAAGAPVLPAGHRLSPGDLAVLAATGWGAVPVHRRLRVGVLSTGDEVVAPGAEAPAHRIFDANRPMLQATLAAWGMVPIDLGIASDSAEDVAAALDRGAAEADAILTTGGASAGDEDHLAAALAADRIAWRVAVKPGRPLAVGRRGGRLVFALPGNPVAAFVCALVFARPALLCLAGAPWALPEPLMLPAAFTKEKRAGRTEFLRARLRAGRVDVFGSEGSGRVSGLAWAEGLVELPRPAAAIRPGDPVRYFPLAAFGL